MYSIRRDGWLYFVLFIGSIFLANYLISNVGTVCPANSPCLIPVWPGILAPSGVLAIGLSFTLRDLVHRHLGVKYTSMGILIGAAVSVYLSPALALASGVAFLLSETLDLLVYTPLQRHNIFAAVLASNTVGLLVDSAVFLLLAFGSLELLTGQVIGKLWMTLVALPIIWLLRRRSLQVHIAEMHLGSAMQE